MINKILLVVAVLASFSLMNIPAANAGTCTGPVCGTISHYSPDNGYDAPIAIRCNYGSGPTKFVYEGKSSKAKCKDTDQVYVRGNEEILCRYRYYTGPKTGKYYWKVTFDAKGWHKIKDNFNRSCVVQRD